MKKIRVAMAIGQWFLAILWMCGQESAIAQGAAAAPNAYPVVDTGQTACYNALSSITAPSAGQAFYGQDAQYSGRQSSYTLSVDGLTVQDNVTGLTWQRSPDTNSDGSIRASDKMTWTQAQARPATLNSAHYGGYSDWRLPTIKELYSLIDFRGTDPSGLTGTDTSGLTPFINTNYFRFAYGDTSAGERIIDSQYASSNLYVGPNWGNEGGKLFGVNFADGRIKGYGLKPGGTDKTFFVQCVRGNARYGLNLFVDNGDQTITDKATGLTWSKADSGSGMNWQAALAWVQTKNAANYLGHNDWRLPNVKELQSIVDYDNAPAHNGLPAIDTSYFTCTAITGEDNTADFPWYWTGTTHGAYNGTGSTADYICFGRAWGYMSGAWVDVHGAGCQRSDPKAGSLSSYTYTPYGYYNSVAPQGDAVRLNNYVRLVRDADYTLTYTAGTGGTISGQASQTVKQGLSGAAVTAVANTGHHFVHWSDAVTSNPRTDANVTASLNVSASFAVTTYTLNITASNGTVVKSPNQTAYDDGTTVALTATPATGYRFTGWTGDVAAGHENDNPLNLTMNGNKSLTASFAILQYTLAYTAGAGGSISGTTPQTVNYGASGAAVTAVPVTGYHFVQWSDGATANPRTDTNVTANLNVTASFGPGQFLWTWMKGATTGAPSGTYGTLGTADAANTPGARSAAASWADSSGTLWLFGGNGKDGTGRWSTLNDLWKYEPATGSWTWIKGASTVDQSGIYGVQGTAAAINTPGARRNAISWIDKAGVLWLFGGNGKDGVWQTGYLNDLWKYEPATGNWTWMKGALVCEQGGTYGTLGMAAAANTPGARVTAVSWTDSAGNLWLFGGYGRDGAGQTGYLNDLWKYEPATGNWTWMKGSATINQSGTYGSLGTAAAANTPGARAAASSWIDSADNLWLFGGDGKNGAGQTGSLNDLWKYEPATGNWTWMKGAATVDQAGIYGTLGMPDAANTPGARLEAISWIDSAGSLWLLGGYGKDSAGNAEVLNDLWKYDPATGNWTWMKGASTINQRGTYGTLGTVDASNSPGARDRAVSWITGAGQLWLFGGGAIDGMGHSKDRINDLWRGNMSYWLSYTAGAGGSISGPVSQTVDHGQNGSSVTAVANTHYHFVRWSDGVTANPRTDANVTAPVTVTAIFALDTYTLSVTATNGTVSKSPDQTTYAHGTAVTLTATTTTTGYPFLGWSGDVAAAHKTDNPLSVTMDQARSLTATFGIRSGVQANWSLYE